MSMHRPGDTTRQINVRVLRAWIAAGRPAPGPREWWHAQFAPHRVELTRGESQGWLWWALTAGLAVAVVVAIAGGTLNEIIENRPSGHIRPMITTTQEVTTVSTMPMSQAKALLNEAISDLEKYQHAIVAATTGPRADAFTKVSAVFRGGYNLQKLNEAMARMEELNNDAYAFVNKIRATSAAIEEAKG